MKKLLLLSLFLSVVIGYAQDNELTGAPTNNIGLRGVDETSNLANLWDISKISGVFYEFDDIRFGRVPTDGSFLLFESWNNKGVLVLPGESLTISNINYHVDEEKFISELDNDSTFVYDFKGIDRIIVNSRPFISLYSSKENKNKVYEVIAEGPKYSLVKNYYSDVTTGSPNPMLNRARNRINVKSNYYALVNGSLFPFYTGKSAFKKITSAGNVSALNDYVKANKLSYKKEKDLKLIFNHLNNLELKSN